MEKHIRSYTFKFADYHGQEQAPRFSTSTKDHIVAGTSGHPLMYTERNYILACAWEYFQDYIYNPAERKIHQRANFKYNHIPDSEQAKQDYIDKEMKKLSAPKGINNAAENDLYHKERSQAHRERTEILCNLTPESYAKYMGY